MKTVAFKIAVSPLILGLTMVGCSTGREMMVRPVSYAVEANRDAAKSHELAEAAVETGDFAQALVHAEAAVDAAPRDAGYRMLLGDLYLKNGRFVSAETAFSDVLTLDPGNSRATLNLALAQIALGKRHIALGHLDRLAETEKPGDLGLAYALAGEPERAIVMLEPAAREQDASARVRQNLALAFALAGDWQRSRVTASQDLSPADLGARMQEWATFAQPQSSYDQVASLFGVTPVVADAGQPVRLALAPVAPEPVAYAEAPIVAPEPVQTVETPVEAPVEAVDYAAAAETLFAPAPAPAVIQASAPKVDVSVRTFAPEPSRVETPRGVTGRYIVQIGAYSTAANVERAWSQAQRRFGLGDYRPVSATASVPGTGKVHRLSIAGFESQSEAAGACRSIKAKGGACFVRSLKGDANTQWASLDVRIG